MRVNQLRAIHSSDQRLQLIRCRLHQRVASSCVQWSSWLATACRTNRSLVRERLLTGGVGIFGKGLRAPRGERASPTRSKFFGRSQHRLQKTLPQPLPCGFSKPPLSTGPLSHKGVLPPPTPSLGALFCQQAQPHQSTAGSVMRTQRPPHCSVPPGTRAASEAHPSCCWVLVLEVNFLVNTYTCSQDAQLFQGRAGAAGLQCSLCVVASQLCCGTMPKVLCCG